MSIEDTLKSLSNCSGGIITTQSAAENGVSRAMLSKLYKQGKLERIAQGQYVFPGNLEDELLSISLRSGRLVFSHETALYLHGLSDRTPFVISVTAPSNCVPAKPLIDICKPYYVKPELFDLGIEIMLSPAGNKIPVYNAERTICDVIRSRNRMGSETVLYAIRVYAASAGKDLNRLRQYAEALRISGVVRRYMEVLL